MLRGRVHPVMALLCLICFGLTNTLLAGGMVVCRDAHGGLRIEWGCGRNSSGECVTSCEGVDGESSDDLGDPHPCQDIPVESGRQIVKAPPRGHDSVLILAPVPVAVLAPGDEGPRPIKARFGARCEYERPPDALRHVRTVVLLV